MRKPNDLENTGLTYLAMAKGKEPQGKEAPPQAQIDFTGSR